MNDNSAFTVLRKPYDASLERVFGDRITTLLAAGVVNPFGPTLTVVAAQGVFERVKSLSIVYLMLNPFKQECKIVCEAQIAATWRPIEDLRQFFNLPFGSCPSLLLSSIYIDDEQSVRLHAEFVRQFSDARSVLERMRKYPGDPWNRVQNEMEHLRKAPSKAREGPQRELLIGAEGVEFARLLLSDKHMKPELKALLFAWNGAIEFQNSMGNTALAARAMTLGKFSEILARIAETCRVPELTL